MTTVSATKVKAGHLPSDLNFPAEAQRDGWLFIPRNGGRDYEDEDRLCNLAQQPLDGDPEELPRYLNPRLVSVSRNVQPPVLHFGWALDEVLFMDIVRQRFPACVQKRLGTRANLESAVNIVSPPTRKDNGPAVLGESVSATCFSSTLRDVVSDYIKVPQAYLKLELVHFAIFWDKQGKKVLGVTAGNNYAGVLNPNTRSRLCQLLDLSESDGKWFLDQRRCYWTARVSFKDAKAHKKQLKAALASRKNRSGYVRSPNGTASSSGSSM